MNHKTKMLLLAVALALAANNLEAAGHKKGGKGKSTKPPTVEKAKC